MRAVVVDPGATPRLSVREVPPPTPAANEALIRVTAFSLNAGETRTALASETAYVPGWDFAGVVEKQAADGTSPEAGTRVFGFVPRGAWAEFVCARGGVLAETPDGVSDAQAAALPVAGATALLCLEIAGPLLGRRVLVTGAAGGVGRFACQLAALAGAEVFGVSRRPDLPGRLEADGVHGVRIFPDMAGASDAGEYDVILDSIGGETLAGALGALATGGVCVNCGNSSNQKTEFDVRSFYLKSNVRLHGFYLAHYRAVGTCTPVLSRLASLVAAGRLRAPIDAELPWTEIAEAADRLSARVVNGKIVLMVT